MSAPDRLTDLQIDDGVAIITMRRTDAHNALSMALCRDLVDALAEAAIADAIVIATAGRNFCVGADLHERRRLLETGFAEARAGYAALIDAVLASPAPVVVAASGYTLGGGLELSLAADLIVADTTAVLGLPEVKIGIVPGGGGTQLLARRVGWGRAVELTLTAKRLDAGEAQRIGLVDRIAGEEGSTAAAVALAREIAANSSSAVRLARAAMRDGWGRELREGLAVEEAAWWTAAESADYRAALDAFGAKRGS